MRALVAVMLAGAVVGCAKSSPTSLVVVTIDSDTPVSGVAALHVRATVGTTTRDFDVRPAGGAAVSIPPAQTLGIDLPRAMIGDLSVHVDARDANGTLLASGDGTGAIRVGARADMTVRLAVAAAPAPDMTDTTLPPDMGPTTPPPDMTNTGDMVVIPPAMLTVDKTMQSFGDITVGKTSTTASFLVENSGGLDSGVFTLSTGGPDVAEFIVTTDCRPALPAGGRCHVTASVTPMSAGMKQATFTLTATPGGAIMGTLTANALTPGAVKITQPSGDCGSSVVGTQSTTTATFTVQNSGASPTGTLSVATSDPQFVASGCAGSTLSPGGMCTVTVKFKPASAGTQNASLTVSASPGGSDTASLVGVGLKPAALRVTSTSYTYASTATGTNGDTATFTVVNDGDVAASALSAASVTGANPSSFVVTADKCGGVALGPSPASCTIAVQFRPQLNGANAASLVVATAGGTVGTVSLAGTGLKPSALAITPTTATFTKGSTASFTVTNGGDVASGALTAATIGGANAASFSVTSDGCQGVALGPSPATCTIVVKFAAVATGTQNATLSLSGSPGGSVSASLSGPGLNPAALAISPASATLTKGGTATFAVTNMGDVASGMFAAATVSGANAASFQITADRCNGMSIGPSPASCTIDVKLAPTTTGTQAATLSISASPGGSVSASLSGPGLNPASLRLAPTAHTFATSPRGTAGETATFTLYNDGEVASATISPTTVTGTNAASFGITADNCKNAPLGPSPASCTIAVQFTPQVTGTNSASLDINVNGGTLMNASLAGTGTPIWVQEAVGQSLPPIAAVWASDASNVYAVGSSGEILYRPSSGTWSTQSLGVSSPPDLTAVAASGSTNVFVTGGNDLYQSLGNGQWSPVRTDGPFSGVWANSSADIWATWDQGPGGTFPNAVYHYTPATGWLLARDASNNALHGSTSAWGTSSSDMFFFGGYEKFQISTNSMISEGDIFHLAANGQFTTQYKQTTQLAGVDQSLAVRSLWGFGAPANNLYAVTTVQFQGNAVYVVLHSAGDGAWNQLAGTPTAKCSAVWGYDASHVFFGCDDGVHLYDGSAWTTSLSSTNSFRGLSGSNGNVFAVGTTSDGSAGVIYHYY